MFETPRIVPHELVHDDSGVHDETRELDMARYGYCYEPKTSFRVSSVPEIEGSDNAKNDRDEDDKEY